MHSTCWKHTSRSVLRAWKTCRTASAVLKTKQVVKWLSVMSVVCDVCDDLLSIHEADSDQSVFVLIWAIQSGVYLWLARLRHIIPRKTLNPSPETFADPCCSYVQSPGGSVRNLWDKQQMWATLVYICVLFDVLMFHVKHKWSTFEGNYSANLLFHIFILDELFMIHG